MTTHSPRWFTLLAAAACITAFGAAQADDLPGPLVTVQWLHDHANAVQIVDIRDDMDSLTNKPKFKTVNGQKLVDQVGSHIPDALSANFWALRESRVVNGKKVDFLLPTQAEFQAVMRASQLEPDKPIVLVPTADDATSLQEAAFLAWELQLYGQAATQVAILDGGMHAWINAGYDLDDDAIAPMTSGHWVAQPARADMLANLSDVQQAQRAHTPLLDARPLAQFAGLDRTPVIPVLGRLKGAKALPAELLYTLADDGSWHFLDAAHYPAVFAAAGMALPKTGIVYCNTGQYAAGAWFALNRLLGYKGLREFPGGMNEWLQAGLQAEH